MASTSSASSTAPARRSITFADLPGEVQAEVIRHCSTSDLKRLSRVSKHFRELAAAELYRYFHMVIPSEDDAEIDEPIHTLAGFFDTLTTSPYNYAQHLRTFRLDSLYLGHNADAIYRPYLAGLSSSKFANVLLCLILRRAKGLESFK